jgi:hypothetical protein
MENVTGKEVLVVHYACHSRDAIVGEILGPVGEAAHIERMMQQGLGGCGGMRWKGRCNNVGRRATREWGWWLIAGRMERPSGEIEREERRPAEEGIIGCGGSG